MSGCLPLRSNAADCSANKTAPVRTARTSTRPMHATTPFESLASYLAKHSSIPPLISTSRVCAPYCSLTVPMLNEVLSTLPTLRLPVEIIASSSERCEVETLWERVSDGELTGDGWERVDVRLLDNSAAGLGEGRFSHIFVHVARGGFEIKRAAKRFLPSLKKNGVLVITCWDSSWDPLLEEAAKAVGRRDVHRTEPLVVVQGTPVKEPENDIAFQAATWETVHWVGSIAMAEWDAGVVLNWIQEDREAVTAGWSLVDKARFEQALRKAVMRVAAEDGILPLKASAVICTKP